MVQYDPLLQSLKRPTSGGSATPTGPAGGDLSGTYPNPTVAKINTNPLGSTTPTSGNLLIADGSSWVTKAMSADATIASTGALTLATVNANVGTFGDSITVPVLTVNAKGLVTAVTTATIVQSPVTAGNSRWYGIAEQLGFTPAVRTEFAITNTSSVSSGGVGTFQDSTGSYLVYTTTTGAGNAAGLQYSLTGTVQPQLLPDCTIVMKTGSEGVTNIRLWMGMVATTLNSIDNPNAAGQFTAAFRFSTGAGDTTWQAVTADGTGSNFINSGISVAGDTRYILRVRFPSTSTVEFSINGSVVGSTSTKVPGATSAMGVGMEVTNTSGGGGGTQRSFRFRKMYIEAN